MSSASKFKLYLDIRSLRNALLTEIRANAHIMEFSHTTSHGTRASPLHTCKAPCHSHWSSRVHHCSLFILHSPSLRGRAGVGLSESLAPNWRGRVGLYFPSMMFTSAVTSAIVIEPSPFTSAASWLYAPAVSLPRMIFTSAVTSAIVIAPSPFTSPSSIEAL